MNNVTLKKDSTLAKKEKYTPGILNTYLGLSNISFKKGKFYNDVEGLFFRRGLLLFDE